MSALDRMLGKKVGEADASPESSKSLNIMSMLTNPKALEDAQGAFATAVTWFKTNLETVVNSNARIEANQERIITMLEKLEKDLFLEDGKVHDDSNSGGGT